MTSRYWSAHTATSASVSVPSNHTIFCCAVGLRRFVATRATSRCPCVPHARTVAEPALMTTRSPAAHTSNVAFRRVILVFISAEIDHAASRQANSGIASCAARSQNRSCVVVGRPMASDFARIGRQYGVITRCLHEKTLWHDQNTGHASTHTRRCHNHCSRVNRAAKSVSGTLRCETRLPFAGAASRTRRKPVSLSRSAWNSSWDVELWPLTAPVDPDLL